jgi:nucleotide-binding universal stress UspA family protein
MINDILVCLEGSPGTAEATRIAIETARESAAALVGLAIVDEPDIRAGAATSIGGASFKHERDESLMADARAQAQAWLATFSERCATAGVTARTLELVGRPADEILEELGKHDLAILARGANFRFETEASDERTRDAILHHASKPVLLVPEQAPAVAAGSAVLIAYDGSAGSKRALASFIEGGLGGGRAIHVVTVDDDGARAWEMADRAARTLRDAGIQPTVHNVVSPLDTTDAILELRQKVDAGLIVLGAYTQLRIAELFRGSVTRGLIELTPVPLYLCH